MARDKEYIIKNYKNERHNINNVNFILSYTIILYYTILHYFDCTKL